MLKLKYSLFWELRLAEPIGGQGDPILGTKDHVRSNWNVFWVLRQLVVRLIELWDTMCSTLTQTEMYFEIHWI